MPGKKKKKFIDKKNAVTFSLVHRSQRDPLQADEDAPQRVLVPTDVSETDHVQFKKEEQQKFGIYFEDDYDYMQHLREPRELNDVGPGELFQFATKKKDNVSSLKLPASVFGSTTETDVGMLNLAASSSGPRLDWDPEVIAALDDDFNYEDPDNQLSDDFVVMAMGDGDGLRDTECDPALKSMGGQATIDYVANQRFRIAGDESDDSNEFGSDIVERTSDIGSDVASDDGQHSFMEEETKTRFTNYSMTSSVIRRNEGLTLVDNRFEKLYEEYDEEEIGALDHEEISGCVPQGSDLLNTVLEEFEKSQHAPTLKEVVRPAEDVIISESESEDDDDLVKMVVHEKPKEQWDCESILSTYSNLYNHPKTIEEPVKVKPIVLTKRAQIPAGSLPAKGSTQKQDENDEENDIERVPTYRPKDETSEEKKERKAAIKNERRLRREQKKMTKTAYKEEKKKQEKELVNIQKNIQGIKII